MWLSVRTAERVTVAAQAPSEELTLRLNLGAPNFPGSANGQLVKTLVDGVCTALHAHGDRRTASEIGRRMAARLARPPAEIAELLAADDRAALGTREQLVALRGHGVQCHPQDERIAALEVEIDRSAENWTLSGRLALA